MHAHLQWVQETKMVLLLIFVAASFFDVQPFWLIFDLQNLRLKYNHRANESIFPSDAII